MSPYYERESNGLLWRWTCSCLRVYRMIQVAPRGVGSALNSATLIYQSDPTAEALKLRRYAAERVKQAIEKRARDEAKERKRRTG